MNAVRIIREMAVVGMLALMNGCASMSPGPAPGDNQQFAATMPEPPRPPERNNGAIYQVSNSMRLFSDQRAHRVGDILTVVLNESTTAKKSADTTTARDTSMDVSNPSLLGGDVVYNGKPLLGVGINSKNSFKGQGDSSQSNQMQGVIAVTVAQVLSNGNLVVQGEKWVALNQGREYIRVRGIVRPADITPRDTVLSTQVANAEISYGGRGVVNDANRPGWLTQFIQAWWPL
ncbi:MAG: flagellar basal body L-ring protein FlgH [Gammaproteobacteria bacterium]|jgi:flagellar L-ring protein precursor FlgH